MCTLQPVCLLGWPLLYLSGAYTAYVLVAFCHLLLSLISVSVLYHHMSPSAIPLSNHIYVIFCHPLTPYICNSLSSFVTPYVTLILSCLIVCHTICHPLSQFLFITFPRLLHARGSKPNTCRVTSRSPRVKSPCHACKTSQTIIYYRVSEFHSCLSYFWNDNYFQIFKITANWKRSTRNARSRRCCTFPSLATAGWGWTGGVSSEIGVTSDARPMSFRI